jgi:DNA adenine methylase
MGMGEVEGRSPQAKLAKTPLRYPGGKAKALTQIARYLPMDLAQMQEFREPFVGGGSMALYLKSRYPHLQLWLNDLNPEVVCFWRSVQQDLPTLVDRVQTIQRQTQDGRALFHHLVQQDVALLDTLERAVRFFILNRITFSGTVESGGFSHQAFLHRFTPSSIGRLQALSDILSGAKITEGDYEAVVMAAGEGVFIFLDPPYFAATKSRLYGKKGDLHTSFDHERFAAVLARCEHRWLITYDDSPEIHANFAAFYRYGWELQYGMNNYKQPTAAKGQELMITNYPAPEEMD